MAYDTREGRSCSSAATASRFGDTWEWDGVSWARVATSGPSRRTDAKMAYDSTRGKVVLFGGATDGKGSCPAVQIRECTPYVCNGSACATSCESDADCAGPHVCDSNGECVLPASEDVVAEQDGGCGCRVAGRKGTGWAPVAGFGVAFLLARARRRRRVGAA